MENIFLKKDAKNGNYICKIGDFGLARELEGGTAITNCGTETYMAPEILSSMKYDKQADIWSLGVLFYYLFCGDFPFKGINILNDIQVKCT
jgi:serine/threonine protein kinase